MSWRTRKRGTIKQRGVRFPIGEEKKLPVVRYRPDFITITEGDIAEPEVDLSPSEAMVAARFDTEKSAKEVVSDTLKDWLELKPGDWRIIKSRGKYIIKVRGEKMR